MLGDAEYCRVMKRALCWTIAVVLMAAAVVRLTLGGGERLEDRSTPAVLSFDDAVEKVADLEFPPGNIAVSDQGRIFFTLHPDGHPPMKVVELVGGAIVPYPSAAWQQRSGDIPWFQSVLSIRIDRQQRLWALDFADYGRGTPRLTAFDLRNGALVHQYDFPASVAGFASMLNDFQVDPSGRYVFIAESSPLLGNPALIVYDAQTKTSRRLLENDRSVRSERLLIAAPGRDMRLPGGLIALRIGVDSIALSRDGQWLYYGPVTGRRLYRIRTADLLDETLASAQLAERVEDFAAKTLSDGLTTDDAGSIYVSDMEHSAVHRIDSDRKLTTIVRDPRLRWPDGFSFGPGGWMYVTCSALQDVLFRGSAEVAAHRPYQIWRVRPGATAAAGH